MSDPRLDELARRLEALPPEAWDRPAPPPPPWPAEGADAGALDGGRFARPADPAQAEPSGGRFARPAAPKPSGGRRRRFALRPVTAGVLAVALLAIGIAVGVLVSRSSDEREIALRPFDGRGAGASASVRLVPRAGGDMTVRVSGLRPSGAGDFYELWLLGDRGRLVSLGSFRMPASGNAEMTLPLPADPARYQFLDVSREPDDGDPGHSGISILRGPST